MEWWETFFDEAYTETWAADGAFDRTEDLVPSLVRFLDLPPGARILDAPCGFGRFAGRLHLAGYDVVGIDGSPDQIRLARQRHPGPDYLVADVREPPSGPYDAVLNLYSSIGYSTDPADDLAAFAAAHGVLAPGGVFVLETMHRDALAHLFGAEIPRNDARKEEGWTDWRTGVRTSTVEIGGERREFRVRVYSATELVAMLEQAGFADIEVHGDFDRTPLDPTTRLAIRATSR